VVFEPNSSFNRLILYNWQQNDRRQFRYEAPNFKEITMSFNAITGQNIGYLQGLSSDEQAESFVFFLLKKAIVTSSIKNSFF